MKVLMINSNRCKYITPVIPIGLCLVSAALERAGHQVKVLDLMFASKAERKIKKALDSFCADMIGISIRNIDDVRLNFFLGTIKKTVIEPCKTLFSGPIIIGGSAVGIRGCCITYFAFKTCLILSFKCI